MNGNADAQYQIAKEYLYDDKDEEAKELFKFALQNGSEEAFVEGWDYFEFDKEILRLLEKLANDGSKPALWALINYYEYKKSDHRNYIKWVNKAVDCGDSGACWVLAKHLLKEHKAQEDIDRAIELLERASDSEKFDVAAAYDLGMILAKGEMVEKDVPRALQYYEKAAFAYDPLWSYECAKYLFACKECGLYTFPSILKDLDCRSALSRSYELAECFSGEDEIATALGVKKDGEKYIKWLNIAAQNGSSGAILRLGKAFYEGKLVPQEYKKAFEYFLLCSKTTNTEGAQYYLGLMYNNGKYVPKNVFMAERWLKLGVRKSFSSSSKKAEELLNTVTKQIKSKQMAADKTILVQMQDFENAVLLSYKKKYDQAIAKFFVLGEYLDSRQRFSDLIPLFQQQVEELISKQKVIKAREALDLLPRESDDLNKLCLDLNDRLKEALKTKKYIVGEKGPAGGIIVYAKDVASDGWQYMEAATNAVSYRLWGKTEKLGTETGVGSGKENTSKILAANPGKKTAAQACLDYEQNGYKDWFLPSMDELSKLILPRYPKKGDEIDWDRSVYCEKHFGTRSISSSSEEDEFRIMGLNLLNLEMKKYSKDDFSLKCIPYRVF